MTKFLILRFSAIGDIVLTSPILRAIKNQVEDSQIHFAVKSKFKIAVQDNIHVDQFFFYNNNITQLIKIWKEENYDYIIDLHHNLRTLWIKLNLYKVPSFSFEKRNFEKWLLVNFKKNRIPKGEHIVDRNFACIEKLGVVNDNAGLEFFIPEEQEKFFFELPSQFQDNQFIAISAAASRATKMFTQSKLEELCSKIDIPMIILGGKEDYDFIQPIEQKYPAKVFNACGKCSLSASAFVLKKSKMVIAYDTGLMHISAALKKPVISVWGNTAPEMGMYPYQTNHWIIEQKMSCRPCSKIGFNECPKKHFDCMNKINLDEIVKIVNEFCLVK